MTNASNFTSPKHRTTRIVLRRVTALWLAMGLLQSVSAETIKTATEDSPIQATISQHEPTRIQVLGDRIAQVIHKSGLFSMQENPAAGEIFITPTPGLG